MAEAFDLHLSISRLMSPHGLPVTGFLSRQGSHHAFLNGYLDRERLLISGSLMWTRPLACKRRGSPRQDAKAMAAHLAFCVTHHVLGRSGNHAYREVARLVGFKGENAERTARRAVARGNQRADYRLFCGGAHDAGLCAVAIRHVHGVREDGRDLKAVIDGWHWDSAMPKAAYVRRLELSLSPATPTDREPVLDVLKLMETPTG